MATLDQGSGGEIAWRAALDGCVRPHVGDISKVYNHCQQSAQGVCAHTCVFMSEYLCARVTVCKPVTIFLGNSSGLSLQLAAKS